MTTPSKPNRERLNTADSAVRHVSGGGLRERTSTVDSIRSIGGGGADSSSEFASLLHIPVASSPPASTRRISVKSPSNNNNNSSSSSTTNKGMIQMMTRRRRFVDWIQKQRVPRRLLALKTSTNQQQQQQQYLDDADHTFWITGLDRVLFGTVAAADAVLILGVKPPRYLWYMLSGAVCDVIQFNIDLFLHMALQIQDASVCWALGFLLSIIFRHSSHRYLVFGDYVGGYRASLTRMYAAYSVIIVLSTIFNVLMTRVAVVSHYVAWILTLLWTGIANYFILKKLWSFGGSSSGSGSSATTSGGSKTMSSPMPPSTPVGK